MNQKTYLQVTGSLFTIAAVVHLSRLLMGWSINVSGNDIPIMASLFIGLVTAYLAYSAFKLMK